MENMCLSDIIICCKSYTYNDGTFLRKKVKFLSVRHNLKFNYVKMPVFEMHFKMFKPCFCIYNISWIFNGIEWLKDERPSDIINFRCLLLKSIFRIFYFGFQTILNKLVKLSNSFFQKNTFEQKSRMFYLRQKNQYVF